MTMTAAQAFATKNLIPANHETGAPCARRYSDGRNLYLNVTAAGSKSWVFIYRDKATGKPREIGLGSATGAGSVNFLGLREARLAADRVRLQVIAGVDVIAEKKAARIERNVAVVTFGDMLAGTVENLSTGKGWKVVDGVCENADDWTRSITKDCAKLIPVAIASITDAMVFDVLRPVWAASPLQGDKVRFRLEKIFAYAMGRGTFPQGPNPARYAGHVEINVGHRATAKKGHKVESHAALSADEVPAVVAQLAPLTGTAAKALLFTMLTAVRTDEARLMKWSEVDLVAARWTIPAERMKAGRDHVVPLSEAALNVLRSIARVPGSDYVFASDKGKTGVLGATALNDKLTDPATKGGLGFKGRATVHGMRATFRTWAASTKRFSFEAMELCLAHAIHEGDKTVSAYDRYDRMAERTDIMNAWADFCSGVSNVVALKVAA